VFSVFLCPFVHDVFGKLTYSWMKQLTWLRIVHSGDWCLLVVHARQEEDNTSYYDTTNLLLTVKLDAFNMNWPAEISYS